ncbi:hypothetical protein KA025_01480 [Candidatus Saccharibacteria bacterium]|nr:hypothetical protein [Candidatus Saccharibacteria bacterium]MBP7834736.1 hypothetical protein [Candidatus Saccharibacteria bacterium]
MTPKGIIEIVTKNELKTPTNKQVLFQNMFVGILLYTVVLGFFNDYTDILHTGTYSVTFMVAVVMQILTYLTFALKDQVVNWFKKKGESYNKLALALSIWAIMFFSKFVFLGAISVIFKDEVEISGFVGLLLIIASLTIAQKIVEEVYEKLGS